MKILFTLIFFDKFIGPYAEMVSTLYSGTSLEPKQTVRSFINFFKSKKLPGLVPPFFLLILGICWTLASPIGSAPDEDFHLTTIWCLKGENNLCNFGIDDSRKVPALWSSWPPCYVSWPNSDKSAECLTNLELPLQLVATNRYSRPGEDPVLFYQVMNSFAGDNPINSVNFMRFFNVLISSFLFLLAIYVAPFIVKRALILSWGLVLIPIGIFNLASTNPSSWTITGVGTLWAFLLSLIFHRKSRNKMFYLSITGVLLSLIISLGSRNDSRIYLLATFIAVALLFVTKKWIIDRKKLLIFLFVTLISVSSAVLWKLRFNFMYPYWYYPGAEIENDQPNAFMALSLEFPSFFLGLLGGQIPANDLNKGDSFENFAYGISWSDFSFPSIVGILLGISFISVISISIKKSSLPKMFSLAIIVFTIVAIIIYVRGINPEVNDSQITPRYILPLFLLLVGLALLSTTANNSLLGPVQSVIITTLLTIGGSIAWLVTISRFSIGPNAAFTNFHQLSEWWGLFPTFSRLQFFALTTLITFFWYLSTIYVWGRMKESNEPIFIKTLKE